MRPSSQCAQPLHRAAPTSALHVGVGGPTRRGGCSDWRARHKPSMCGDQAQRWVMYAYAHICICPLASHPPSQPTIILGSTAYLPPPRSGPQPFPEEKPACRLDSASCGRFERSSPCSVLSLPRRPTSPRVPRASPPRPGAAATASRRRARHRGASSTCQPRRSKRRSARAASSPQSCARR